MSGRSLRYQFLRRDELENELFALCLRLRQSRPKNEAGGRPRTEWAARGSPAEGFAARRCFISSRVCTDLDFPRLLEADERARALIGTLNEAASLLDGFAQYEQSGRGRHLPS